MDTIVALPSNHPGGLEAKMSEHFGQCDVFTLVTLDDNGVKKVDVVSPAAHAHGGCMVPVKLLGDHGVGVLIAQGIGRRPLEGFAQTGIMVLHAGEAGSVGEKVEALRAGQLARFDLSNTCGGAH